MKRYYQILELPINASPRRIKEQYRKLAKLYHPDTTANPADKVRFAEKFREINDAYEALAIIVTRANLAPHERKLDYLYTQGKNLYDHKKWSRAMVVFNEILAVEPTYKDTRARLREARRKHKRLAGLYAEADVSFQQQNWAEAMAGFSNILREDPDYKDAVKKYKKAKREQLMTEFMNK